MDDLDLVISLAMLTVVDMDGVEEEDVRERESRGKKGKRRRRRVLYTTTTNDDARKRRFRV